MVLFNVVCCLSHRGNFIGTSFTVYDSGENPLTGDVLPDMSNVREELCAVVYVSAGEEGVRCGF